MDEDVGRPALDQQPAANSLVEGVIDIRPVSNPAPSSDVSHDPRPELSTVDRRYGQDVAGSRVEPRQPAANHSPHALRDERSSPFGQIPLPGRLRAQQPFFPQVERQLLDEERHTLRFVLNRLDRGPRDLVGGRTDDASDDLGRRGGVKSPQHDPPRQLFPRQVDQDRSNAPSGSRSVSR